MTAPSSSTRRGPWLIAALVLVPLAVIGGAYLLFFTDDSAEKITFLDPPAGPGTDTTAAGSSGSTSLEGTWTVAAGSEAGYRVREKLARLPAQSDAVGRTESVTGTVTIRSTGGQLVADAMSVSVDVSTLKSDEDRRDNRTREALGTDQNPSATFVSTAPVTLPAGIEAGGDQKAEVTGRLTLHGVTRDVTIPIDIRLADGSRQVIGSYTFPFADFDITPPNIANFVTLGSDATLEFRLVLARA